LEEDLKKTPFQKALEERAKRLEQVLDFIIIIYHSIDLTFF
jgi:hypothetical protein